MKLDNLHDTGTQKVMVMFCFVLCIGVFNLICLTLLVIGSFAAKIPENDSGKKWVVLLSGSAGWNNYRHQVNLKNIILQYYFI